MRIDSNFFDQSLLGLDAAKGVGNVGGVGETDGEASFANLFNDMMDSFDAASAESKESTAKLLTGSLDDMSELLVNSEKSGILFDLNLAVRNKVLDAFTEIMRTQV